VKIKTNHKQHILTIFLLFGIVVLILSGCSNPGVSLRGVKILFDEEGIYKVDVETLAKAGLTFDGIDLKQLRLSNRGEPLPLFVFQEGDSAWLEFYGRDSKPQYSLENIYILDVLEHENEQTVLVNEEDEYFPSSIEPVNSIYYATQWFEENQVYFPQVNGSDNWYWMTVVGGQSQIFPIRISELMPGEGYIRLDLWSNTEAPADPDHHLLLRVNNQTVIDKNWDGRGGQLFTASIPEGIMVEGENQVVIDIPGDTQATAESYWINWFEVTYPRRAITQMGQIIFVATGKPLLLSGFRDQVQLFDITEDNQVFLQQLTDPADSDLKFTGLEGHTYYAIDDDGFREPISVTPLIEIPDLRADTIGADYLAIGPDEYLSSAGELFSHREAQGLRVMQIPLQAIYDQFNFGLPEPDAIRRFLIEAAQIWETFPQYVLLIGDASYDPRNYLQQPVTNILPSFFVQTIYGGQTVSDLPFADLDADGIPDIAVGRIPATTAEEVMILVRKTIEQENAYSAQDGKIHLLAIADGQEVGFRIDAQHFVDIFPPDDEMVLYNPSAGTTDANRIIQSYFNEGYSFIAYFGHGSVVMWGKDRLFSVDDATALANAQYPVLINMTCLTGLFTHPTTESLTEAFLFNPSGGAVAILAPTSLTLSGEQSRLSTPLAETISSGVYSRLGDVYLSAQRKMAMDSPGVQDVLETFLLFGDPGLIINPSK
jgi:hypothetical protein